VIFGGFNSQIFTNESGEILTDEPFFNEKLIRSVKLKALFGIVSSKKELGAIQSTGKKQVYMFNEKGNLVIQYNSKRVKKRVDTSFIFYEYNPENNLTLKRYSDSYGFYSYSYKYNNKGLVNEQVYSREKNISKSKLNFKLGQQYVIFKEGYTYNISDTVIGKTILNSNGRPYQENIIYFDQLGYKKRTTTRLLINNKIQKELFSYNEKGFLKAVEYYKGISEKPYKTLKYDYDEWGNVTFIDEYKNEERIIHKEILYDPSTLLLKTILSQDLITNLITIIKFKPEFYN